MLHKVDDCMDFEVFSFWNTIAIAAMNFTIREWLLIIGGGGGTVKFQKGGAEHVAPPKKNLGPKNLDPLQNTSP